MMSQKLLVPQYIQIDGHDQIDSDRHVDYLYMYFIKRLVMGVANFGEICILVYSVQGIIIRLL